MRRRPVPRLTLAPAPPLPPVVEDTPDGVRIWCRPRGGRETWEVIVRRGEPLAGLVVRLAWDLRVPVDAAETLASEVLVRLGAAPSNEAGGMSPRPDGAG